MVIMRYIMIVTTQTKHVVIIKNTANLSVYSILNSHNVDMRDSLWQTVTPWCNVSITKYLLFLNMLFLNIIKKELFY